MKFSSLLTIALVAGATSTQASLIPPELQARFLQEHDQLETELDAWKRSPVGQFARESGFFVDDTLLVSVVTQADQLARFFLSKISIEQAQRRNPNAIFSLATPFTLMTKDEFAKFVQRSAIDFGAWGPLHNTTTSLHASRNLQPRPHYHKSTKPPTQPPATTEPATEPPTEAPATTETPTETPVTTAPPTEAPATTAPATRYPVAPKTTEPPATTTSQPATTAAPASSNSKDWTQGNCVSAIKNQGQCGSCWAFSSIATLETAYCLQHGNLTLLSEQELVSCETKDNGCDGGAQVNAFSYIQSNRGVSTEASYPYTSGDSETSGTCNKQGTTKFPLSITAINSVAANDAAFKAATDKQPIAVLVASGNDEWKQYKGGVLSSCSTTEVDHGVVVVGYDDDSFKIRNSWGTWWGDHGYIRLQRISATEAACSLINEWATYPTVA